MKTALWLILAFSLGWLALLASLDTRVRPHFMLDAILPPRILNLTTYEEQKEIVASLGRALERPSTLAWMGACLLFGISVYGLWNAGKTSK